MTTLLEKISDLNDLVLQGKVMEAFEKYYHPEVVMQENEEEPTVGKEKNRQREKDFYAALISFKAAKPLKVTVGEGVTMVEWFYDYIHQVQGHKKYTQISVQEWKDGQIIMEKFYYNA